MAFIPDEAFDHATEISKTAFVLYSHICRWRNHRHQNTILNHAATGHTLGLSRSQLYRTLRELSDKQWIVRKGDFITMLVGSFQPVNRAATKSQICDSQSHICDEKSQICDSTLYSNPAFKPALKKTAENISGKTKSCRNCVDGWTFDKLTKTSNHCYECDQAVFI